MAENNKRRGRPKKEKTENIIANEEKEFINMSEENNTQSQPVNTASTTSATSTTDRITMDTVQQRWAQIFGKYGKAGFDTVSRAWNLAWNQANNPFLQNARIKQSVAKPLKAQ